MDKKSITVVVNSSKVKREDQEAFDEVFQENFGCFFEGEISKDNIIYLTGTGDIKKNIPSDLNVVLKSYISILQKREK